MKPKIDRAPEAFAEFQAIWRLSPSDAVKFARELDYVPVALEADAARTYYFLRDKNPFAAAHYLASNEGRIFDEKRALDEIEKDNAAEEAAATAK